MKLNWDAIGGITQIITVVYLFYQFHYLPNKARKESLEHLRILFMLSRSKVEKLIEEMTFFHVANDCKNAEFLPNVTFKTQLLQLHHLLLNDLNDEALENVINMATTDPLIATAVGSINKQIESFTLLEAHFNTVFKFKQI